MATKKKAKSRVVKSSAKKRVKKTAAKKVVKKKTLNKKRVAGRTKQKKKIALQTAARPAATVPTPVAPAAGEARIGVVIHYYTHLAVAIVQIESGTLREGDTIHIKGHTSDFRQRAGAMEIDHVRVAEVRAGQSFGLKVKEHAREHDVVYKVAPAQVQMAGTIPGTGY